MTNIGTATTALVNREMYECSKTVEILEYVFLTILAITIPLSLQHPQLLVGSTVNFVLIMTATNIKGWGKVLSLITFPSISAFLGTSLWGSYQILLLYMIPFIWIGNAILVFSFKQAYVVKKIPFLLTLPIAAVVKAGFLYSMAMLLVKFSVIPIVAAPVLAVNMGILQVETALIGGCAAFVVNMTYRVFVKEQ